MYRLVVSSEPGSDVKPEGDVCEGDVYVVDLWWRIVSPWQMAGIRYISLKEGQCSCYAGGRNS